jgi:hypothetical protein
MFGLMYSGFYYGLWISVAEYRNWPTSFDIGSQMKGQKHREQIWSILKAFLFTL